jgi:peptide/nickel transport system ATP-binding protein
VADIADRVVVMYAGRKIEEASTEELFRRPQHPYIAGLLRAVPRRGTQTSGRRRLQDIPGVVPTLSSPPTSCVFHPRCSRATDICRTELPPLQEHGDDHRVACFHTVNQVGEGATHG